MSKHQNLARTHLEKRPEVLGDLGGEEAATDVHQRVDGIERVEQNGSPGGQRGYIVVVVVAVDNCGK